MSGGVGLVIKKRWIIVEILKMVCGCTIINFAHEKERSIQSTVKHLRRKSLCEKS